MSIAIRELTAGYGDRIILNNISLEVAEGSICALLGKNGSGKTTLFRCISSLIKPREGNIKVKGQEIARLKKNQIASLISMVPQKTGSVFSYSVVDMVLMGEAARLNSWGSPGKEAVERALKACDEVGILHLTERNYNELSGGEQQLVLLARAVMQDTPVMLLDEPTSHLDFCNQHKVMDMLRRIARMKGVTVLITLHDPNIAYSYCDDAIMMEEGTIVTSGRMKDVFNDRSLKQVYGSIIRTDFTSRGFKVVVPELNDVELRRERSS